MHEKNQDLHRERVHKHKDMLVWEQNLVALIRLFLYLQRDTTIEELLNAQTYLVMLRMFYLIFQNKGVFSCC